MLLHLYSKFISIRDKTSKMITITSEQNTKKSNSIFKYLFIIIAIGIVGTMIFALVRMFLSFLPFGSEMDTQKLLTSSYILYGVAGAVPLLLVPTMFLWINSRRKVIMNNVKTSFQVRGIGPYATSFQFSGAKKARFCQYCGFEVRSGERECPECSGPVRNIDL